MNYSTKLIYFQSQRFNNTATPAVAAMQVFRANSLFDPDLSGGGHQPLGRDTMASLYDEYFVWKCKITVTFVNYSNAIAPICGININNDATVRSAGDYIENQNTKYLVLAKDDAGPCTGTLSYWVDMIDFTGKQLSDLSSAMSTTPSEQVYFSIFGIDTLGTTAIDVNVITRIEYYATFTEPVHQAQN